MAQDYSSNSPNESAGSSVNPLPAAIRIIPSRDFESEPSEQQTAAHLADASRVAGEFVVTHADEVSGQLRESASTTVPCEGDDEDFVAVDHEDLEDYSWSFQPQPRHGRSRLDQLHPFVQLLSLANVDDCVKVEEAFPENERCSREKVCVHAGFDRTGRSDAQCIRVSYYVNREESCCYPTIFFFLCCCLTGCR